MIPIVAAAGSQFEDLGNFFFLLLLVVKFELHDFAEFLRFGSIHRQHYGAAKERLLDGRDFFVERNEAFAPGLIGILDQQLDCRSRILGGLDKYMRQPLESAEGYRQRILNEDRAECASKHNHGCGRLQYLP